jgi:hypothetical protein
MGVVVHVCNPSSQGAYARGTLEVRNSRPDWGTKRDTISEKKMKIKK